MVYSDKNNHLGPDLVKACINKKHANLTAHKNH